MAWLAMRRQFHPLLFFPFLYPPSPPRRRLQSLHLFRISGFSFPPPTKKRKRKKEKKRPETEVSSSSSSRVSKIDEDSRLPNFLSSFLSSIYIVSRSVFCRQLERASGVKTSSLHFFPIIFLFLNVGNRPWRLPLQADQGFHDRPTVRKRKYGAAERPA